MQLTYKQAMQASVASSPARRNTKRTIHLYIQPPESLEGKKAPCHRLRLFNSLTLTIYKLKVFFWHILYATATCLGEEEQTSCFVETPLFVKDVVTLCKRRENIFIPRIPHPRHLTGILLGDIVASYCYLRTVFFSDCRL